VNVIGVGTIALEKQITFYVYLDADFVFARIAPNEADRLAVINEFHIPDVAAFVVIASALDGLRVGVLGIREVVEQLGCEPGHVGAIVEECPRGDQ